ncbi:hypothetical protein GOV13_02690 [Candidatus Pacearchaeota archaeon]|nr:hypothetical protein [Candidatus Pacearchaeota archaeon]
MSFADAFRNPWFILLFTLTVVFFTGAIIYSIFVQVTEHRPFCESIGLQYDGRPEGELRGVNAITCSGISSDGKAVIKHFFIEDGKYYELSLGHSDNGDE